MFYVVSGSNPTNIQIHTSNRILLLFCIRRGHVVIEVFRVTFPREVRVIDVIMFFCFLLSSIVLIV